MWLGSEYANTVICWPDKTILLILRAFVRYSSQNRYVIWICFHAPETSNWLEAVILLDVFSWNSPWFNTATLFLHNLKKKALKIMSRDKVSLGFSF